MKICIEDKNGKCGFFRVDGRKLDKFVSLAKKANPQGLSNAWTYTGIEKLRNSTVGVYQNVKQIEL